MKEVMKRRGMKRRYTNTSRGEQMKKKGGDGERGVEERKVGDGKGNKREVNEMEKEKENGYEKRHTTERI